MKKSLILVALTATAALSMSHAFAAAGTVNFVGNILDTACEVDVASQNQQVNLGNFYKTEFPSSGTKAAAKDFILQNESYDRSYYSGFLGELNIDLATFRTEQSDLFVNLRCMKINDKHVELFIGCGITKDSVPEAEFIETVNKSMTMRKVLN